MCVCLSADERETETQRCQIFLSTSHVQVEDVEGRGQTACLQRESAPPLPTPSSKSAAGLSLMTQGGNPGGTEFSGHSPRPLLGTALLMSPSR